MDTSEEYIKMCDCPEVQEGWEVRYGDWVGLWVYSKGEKYIANTHIIMDNYPALIRALNGTELTKSECLWLPRQDQIQEMLIGCRLIFDNPYDYCYNIWKFSEQYRTSTDMFNFGSMEQLWLVFYIYEKHGLAWDGEKWSK